MDNTLKKLLTIIAGGIIAGLIVGIFLYNLYEIDPKLYVTCGSKMKTPNILNVNIENSGEPAIDVFVYLIPQNKNVYVYRVNHIDKIGKESVFIDLNIETYKKEYEQRYNYTEEYLRVKIQCDICDNKKISYGRGCFTIK